MDHKELADDWLALWNGDYTPANHRITPDFTIHAALLDGSDSHSLRGPHGLVGWIAQIRSAFSALEFTVEVGPITTAQHLVLRWIATGVYSGGFPGATAPTGTLVSFTGIDILRLEDEKLAEYWVNSDTHLLLTQLGVPT
jgi:predicted ester cyclase